MDNLNNITANLRNRLTEYRVANLNEESSTHINAVEIAVCLVEFYLESNSRRISLDELNWFKASYYVQLVLENSEWEDISEMYMELCSIVNSTSSMKKL